MAKKEQQSAQQNLNSDFSITGVWTLYFISIICGAILMGLEIAGGRLLSPFFGSSIYVWGSVISVFLIALSAGYYYGGILADRRPDIETLGVIIGISGLLLFIIPFTLSLAVDFSFSANLQNLGALFVAMVLFFPPSVGLGMVSPYIVKLGVLQASKVGKLVGKFYSVSTFGSIIGTFGMTFILSPLFGVRKMIYAMGIVLFLVALYIFAIKKKTFKSIISIIAVVASITVSMVYAPAMALSIDRGQVLYEKESLYNNLAVVDGRDGLRYLLFNETEQSAMDPQQPDENVFQYTKLMTNLGNLYRPDAKSTLLIGLGGGTIPKYIDAHQPQVKMDTVEIDPEVVNVAKKYFYLEDNDRIHNYAEDGRMFLKNKKALYDVIYIDAYNRAGIPFHLATKEFFEELATALKPGGIVIFNVVGGIEGENGQFFRSLVKTSTQVLPEWKLHFAYPTNHNYKDINNLIYVVSKDKLPEVTAKGFEKYTGKIDLSDSMVLTDDYAPVDNLNASVLQTLSSEYSKLREDGNS